MGSPIKQGSPTLGALFRTGLREQQAREHADACSAQLVQVELCAPVYAHWPAHCAAQFPSSPSKLDHKGWEPLKINYLNK